MDRSETTGSGSMVGRFWAPAALTLLIAGAIVCDQLGKRPVPRPIATPAHAHAPLSASRYRNTEPGVAYVGDEVCARCHAEIARTYRGHPMGRSMTRSPGSEPAGDGVVFTAGDLVYSVIHRDGRVVHREARRDAQGRLVASTEADVRYLLGSGRRGIAFLVERRDGLYQSPIGWYAEGRRWDLSPLYEMRNLHFDRPITPGCLFCHTNRFEVSAGRPPLFHGLAIGCERCHGPGALHAERPEKVNGRDDTIVNPADLEPRSLRESVCEQCHLQGSSRRNQPGRSVFDFRPGLPLDTFVVVSYAPGDPISSRRAVGHVEQMRQSRCYQESGEELGCISCHDPHRLPTPEERVGYYRSRCQECHARQGCSLPRDRRLAQRPDDDCTACHMPRSRAGDIAHTAITVHSIPRHLPATR